MQQSFKRLRMTLLTVERIQNKIMRFNYYQLYERFLARNEEPHEQTLFHGTGDTNPDKIVSTLDGLNYHCEDEVLWGRALYFAYNVRLSNCYSFRLTRTSLKSILM